VFLTKYHLGDQIQKTEMGRACGTNGLSKGAYRVLVGKPEGRRPLERLRCRWILEKWDGNTDWIDLAQDRKR
jgi:hypothetical protein